MTTGFLVVLAAIQGILLIVILAGLFVGHRVSIRRDRRRVSEGELVRDTLRRFVAQRLMAEEALEILDGVSHAGLDFFVREFSGHSSGNEGEAVRTLLRATRWHARILRRARSRFWWRRLGAARAIASVAVADHLLIIHELLDDDTPAVRLTAASALERLPSPALAAAILDRAIARHAVARNHLVELLARSKTIVLPVLVDRLITPASPTQLRVLLDLGARLGYPSLLQYVIPHADSASPEVRIAAATCLTNFPHPQSSAALRRLLTDESWQVRARAAASLGAIGAIEAAGDLRISLCDPNWWVRLRSAIALRLVGPVGHEALRAAEGGGDRYAADMARYVMQLDDGAMAEYVGGSATDFATTPSGALAS